MGTDDRVAWTITFVIAVASAADTTADRQDGSEKCLMAVSHLAQVNFADEKSPDKSSG